ncbi:MAG: glutamyl-tRNA reductase [Anaerolineae bacterium]|nr:MAG: glutamyl-tRNA reductase [Anaerolineae bacterium]
MSLNLYCLGISHHTASVDLRERLAFEGSRCAWFTRELQSQTQWEEVIILSTCNRAEVYVAGSAQCSPDLVNLLAEGFKVDRRELENATYAFTNEQVISHLFRVAAGLDSMVLGEPQILGQITDAYETAVAEKSLGPRLSKLFLSAIHAGKRVRTETRIGRHSLSIPSLAVTLAQRHVGDLATSSITLLGAGEMAELAMDVFHQRGATQCTVISRSLSSACKLADRWQGEAATMDRLVGALSQTDILVSSSSAPHALILQSMIEAVMVQRPDRPLVILDIAVPRDVEPEVKFIPNVTLYDIDDLQNATEANHAWRAGEIPAAESILSEEYRSCLDNLLALQVAPVIKELRQRGEAIRLSEMRRTLRHLDDLSPEHIQRIESLTQAIVQKLLHQPTVRLREESGGARGEQYGRMVSDLFGLESPPTIPTRELP